MHRIVSNRFFAWSLAAVLAAACVVCAFFRFARYHVEPPKGCDQFGYTYQAQAVREGNLFSSHTQRPFLAGLVEKLASDNPNADDYRWMIAPHAYHYVPKVGKIINQYPPGTAVGLALFPVDRRGIAYPALVMISMALLLLLLMKEEPADVLMYGGAILFFATLQMIQTPFSNEYRSVGSVAPTCALLFASGWFLRKRPLLSIAFLSSTFVIRIANVWLLPVFALAYIFSETFSEGKFPTIRDMAVRCAKAATLTLFCGGAWILLYQWMLLGNPFAPTYSEIDRSFTSWSDVISNCRFYFAGPNNWFYVNAALVAISCALFASKGRRLWIVWAALLVAWNYAFFLTHKVAITYYPYASALTIAGLVVSGLDVFGGKTRAVLAAAFVAAPTIVLYLAWNRPDGDFLHNYAKEEAAFRETFGRADVVWGDLSTGSAEYTTRKAAMRFFWGTPKARDETLNYLRDNGCVQAVMLDDGGMRPDEALAALKESGVEFSVETSPRFGRVAWIPASEKR